MQKTARPGSVNYKTGANRKRFAVTLTFHLKLVAAWNQTVQRHFIEILDAQALRFTDKKMIEVGAIPMRVGYLVVSGGRDQQLIAVIRLRREGMAKSVMIESEAALQTAS